MTTPTPPDILQVLGHKPLSKTWAKVEIFLGLAAVFVSLALGLSGPLARSFGFETPVAPLGIGLALFVLGGYLAMAGQRSHLYQSSNATAALLLREIRKGERRPRHHEHPDR
ncbi:MAG: hypothetical protein U0793_23235 [Gemmataceae bacterium]